MFTSSELYTKVFVSLTKQAASVVQRGERLEIGDEVLIEPPDELRDKNKELTETGRIAEEIGKQNVRLENGDIIPRTRLRRYYRN